MADELVQDELTDPPILRLLGHGTNGSDGIEPGIHLRWAFNHKLGFPDCVRLFRRPSFTQNHYVWNYLATAFTSLPIPSTHEVVNGILEFEFGFASVTGINSFPIVSKAFDGQVNDVLYIKDGELHISFSVPVSRIELGFLVVPASNFQIIVDDAQGGYFPQSVFGSFPGWKDIYFDAPGATGVTLRGKEINLFHLAVWICSEVEAVQWTEIKIPCGCGVPLIPSTTPAPHMIDQVFPVVDVPRIDCRLNLGGGTPAPFTRDDILEIADLFLSIFEEGSTLPHGWTLFESDESGEETTAEVSIYDYLLAQSLHVPVAKVFDLYFVDKPQNQNVYFDYKIETSWPEWNLRQLDQQITFEAFELGQRFDNLFRIGDLFFLDAGSPEIVEAPNTLARTAFGLALSDTVAVTIFRFLKPVTDVQLWLLNSDPATEVVVEAHQDYHVTYKDKRVLNGASGILRLHADQIDSIRIQGRNVILSRLHYEDEAAPYFLQTTMICGVKRGTNAYSLEKPSGLTVSFIPGGPVNTPELTFTNVPYQAGLRWDANEDENKKLLPHHPFGYHIERRLGADPPELLTQDVPLVISPQDEGTIDVSLPEGWPEQRQFYFDHLDSVKQYNYHISALDLFGRQSPFGDFKTFTIKVPPPPPPTEVTAHFLDFSTFDPATGTFSDPALLEVDKDWLRTNQQSAIVVRWQWPQALALQAPDVDNFRILLKEGWLNTYAGTIASAVTEKTIAKASLNLTADELSRYPLLDTYTNIPVLSFQVTLKDGPQFARDALRLSWLRLGNTSFLVLTNTTGTSPTLEVLKFEAPPAPLPIKGQGISLSITAGKPGFVDYSLARNWTTNPLQHLEPNHTTTGGEAYTVYLPAPPFPVRPVTLKEPSVYGQIGVCAVAKLIDGGVSIPATIMAIYQGRPARPAPAVVLPDYQDLETLKATPANVHGKSTFAVRWRKSGDGVQHFVFRAMDTTLFLVDNARRRNGDSADYTPFADPKYNPADVDAIRQIEHAANADAALAQYASLTPSQLFILANLAENDAAYTRLHSQPIYEDDSEYQDRDTGIPDPLSGATYTPDPNLLLYSDATLDGRGTNRYFYRVKTTGANGLSSEFGESTLPVESPRTTPPPRPVITAIAGGENQITIKWAKQPGSPIAGYLLYRTQEKAHATDWRRMELIKANEADPFTVAVNGSLPQQGFEFVDTTVTPGQAYYYGVVAVGLSDSGKQLKSIISVARIAQAYDLAPPPPPEFVSLARVELEDGSGIVVQWRANEQLSFLLKRSEGDSGLFRSISEWVAEGTHDEASGTWNYIHQDEQDIRSDTQYRYVVVAKDQSGNLSSSEESDPV